jgi:hypothetical protein
MSLIPPKKSYSKTRDWLLRSSEFGLLSDFGLRVSDFSCSALARR